MADTPICLIPTLEISPASEDALTAAVAELLAEDWPIPNAGLIAPDVLLDLCAQYVVNTRKQFGRWDADELVEEYLRQMRGEGWATVRQVAERPRRGSLTTQRLFLGLVHAAARRRERPPLGQARAMALVAGAYLRVALRLGSPSIWPLTLPLSWRDLGRIAFDVESAWFGQVTRAVLRRHVESGGLAHGPCLLHAWRLALVAVAVVRRGAVALARARGEAEVDRGCLEQALSEVEEHLLTEGQLWAMLSRTSLVRDVTVRFLSRRVSVPTLLML